MVSALIKKMKIIFVEIRIFGSKVIFLLLYFGYINVIYGYTDVIQVIQAKTAKKIPNYTD